MDPLKLATPAVDDVEARRARAAIEGRLFSGPPTPVKVGRYRVEGRIGSGGMGVVYRAHDPELARDVAVKVVNPEAVGETQASLARARLVREARAMARLAHPNVIHVYDVGTVSDGVFIAMELVEGESLAKWLGKGARSWREVLALAIDAGRGLAAAHAAGVVHRDFKPENVLVGTDGRVRVGDFGLAGAPAQDTGSYEPTGAESIEEAEIDSQSLEGLTRTGALLGTPKYMAPEQETGAPANARSDQFSFCVTLYEALYGVPPFEGDTVTKYRRNVRRGEVKPAPPGSPVPAWVHDEIVRGLAGDPAQRHPGLDALLDRLARAVEAPAIARRRRALATAALFGTVIAALAVGFSLGRGPSATTTTANLGIGLQMRGAVQATREASPPSVAVPVPPLPLPPEVTSSHKTKVARHNKNRAAPKVTRKRGRGHCYFIQDRYTYLARSKKRQSFVRVREQCYACGTKASDSQFQRLFEEGSPCAHKYICNKESPDKCGT